VAAAAAKVSLEANENLLMNFPSSSHQHKANELLNFSFRRRCWTSLDLSLNCKFFTPLFFVCHAALIEIHLSAQTAKKELKRNTNQIFQHEGIQINAN
jgi:hypothetical protein